VKRKTGHAHAGLRRRVGADAPCRSTRRNLLIALGAGALAAPLSLLAQPQGKVWRIGFLSSESASGDGTRVEALRAGLRDLGYEEGKNLVIELRWADGKNDRLPELAAELVRLNVDVLVTYASPAIRAAKQATTTIPIVMAAVADPVALGLVASLARPGGNITGSTFFITELAAKRIELLKEALPRITQVAVLFDPAIPPSRLILQAMETTARSLKVTLHEFAVRGPSEFESAFAAIVKKRVGAIAVMENPMFIANAKTISDLAAKARLPLIGNGEVAEAGGMIGYGANLLELYRRAAYFVDRILKGANPGAIPVEQPTRFELVINLRTAKALGIKISQSLLQRADKVIE
jgi:putative ABC transport system substrate-binding protein